MAITWFSGNTGSGKTTKAKAAAKPGDIILDGNELRRIWLDLDLSEAGRREQSRRTARLAKYLESQGFNVYVAVIAPYRDLREEIKGICGCEFVYVPGGQPPSPHYPYEPPLEGYTI